MYSVSQVRRRARPASRAPMKLKDARVRPSTCREMRSVIFRPCSLLNSGAWRTSRTGRTTGGSCPRRYRGPTTSQHWFMVLGSESGGGVAPRGWMRDWRMGWDIRIAIDWVASYSNGRQRSSPLTRVVESVCSDGCKTGDWGHR